MVQSHRIKINWESTHCSLAAADCLLVCRVHVCASSSIVEPSQVCVSACVPFALYGGGHSLLGVTEGAALGWWIGCFCAQSLSCLRTRRRREKVREKGAWGEGDSQIKGEEKIKYGRRDERDTARRGAYRWEAGGGGGEGRTWGERTGRELRKRRGMWENERGDYLCIQEHCTVVSAANKETKKLANVGNRCHSCRRRRKTNVPGKQKKRKRKEKQRRKCSGW